jgi:two-component system nitrate/nitrite response regulator NarL
MSQKMDDFLNPDMLSMREREVMLLAAKGLANKVIARELNVTEGTIKLHLHSVYQKLGIKSRLTLAVSAAKLSRQPTRRRNRAIRSKEK